MRNTVDRTRREHLEIGELDIVLGEPGQLVSGHSSLKVDGATISIPHVRRLGVALVTAEEQWVAGLGVGEDAERWLAWVEQAIFATHDDWSDLE